MRAKVTLLILLSAGSTPWARANITSTSESDNASEAMFQALVFAEIDRLLLSSVVYRFCEPVGLYLEYPSTGMSRTGYFEPFFVHNRDFEKAISVCHQQASSLVPARPEHVYLGSPGYYRSGRILREYLRDMARNSFEKIAQNLDAMLEKGLACEEPVCVVPEGTSPSVPLSTWLADTEDAADRMRRLVHVAAVLSLNSQKDIVVSTFGPTVAVNTPGTVTLDKRAFSADADAALAAQASGRMYKIQSKLDEPRLEARRRQEEQRRAEAERQRRQDEERQRATLGSRDGD